MKIPRYWVRVAIDEHGNPIDKLAAHSRDRDGFWSNECLWALGWSDQSLTEAKQVGLDRARDMARRYAQNTLGHEEYPYPNRPVREELIQRPDDQTWAITRNSYGSLVLNTANVMFVDIDASSKPLPGFWNRLLKRSKVQPIDTVIQNTRQIAAAIPGLGARLYHTAAGLRLLITSHPHDPASQDTSDLLTAFGSDQRYAALCRIQESFRARLTPKPWRCRCPHPPFKFPYELREQTQQHAKWVERYQQASQPFSVCRFVEHLGNPTIHPTVQPVLALHDQYTMGQQSKPLA